MQSSHKTVCGGPSQKKMFSFVSCSKKMPDVIRKPLESSSVSSVKSYTVCLDRFKSTSHADADSEGVNQNPTKEETHGHKSVLLDSIIDENGVKTETVNEDTEFRSYDALVPEMKSEHEDRISSPEAKRARREDDPPDSKFKMTSLELLDSPVSIQKKTVLLPFSLQELSKRIQRLQAQQREDSEPKYRRFRAKISPGENQSAEDELKKEIWLRFCYIF